MNVMGNSQSQHHWKVLVLLLKEIADDKGITQIEIAEKSGQLQSNISRTFSLTVVPRLDTFLAIARAVDINFFFEDKEGTTDLALLFERAMTELGRRPDNLPKN